MNLRNSDADTEVATLANGVRVVSIRLPYLDSVAVSVFVRTGSRHESKRLNGVSHFVEHMAFKGTTTRDCQQINLDAERLGAEVNAHTDKDHTAYHMRGLARDAGPFLQMLGDIVRHGSFPEAELERERQVILQEYTEDEDDPLSTAYKLFDKACFGLHPLAQPVIGTRRNIQQISRADLLDYVARQYSGANVVVGVAGNVDHDAVRREAAAAFGTMPRGVPNAVDTPAYLGGGKTKAPGRLQPDARGAGLPDPRPHRRPSAGRGRRGALRRRHELAADGPHPRAARPRVLRGLLGRRVRRVRAVHHRGVDVARAPGPLLRGGDAAAGGAGRVHRRRRAAAGAQPDRGAHARRARKPFRRLEDAAQDLFVFGRLRSREEILAQIDAVTPAQLRATFERLLATRAAVALAGKVPQQAGDRVVELVARR
jgi:predicted Zn-dependent peptidase